jgi:hypothetical protein
MVAGDLAPAYSGLYPELLDAAGLSEAEFRRVVQELNGRLGQAFDPYKLGNVVDVVLGLVTGWVWDDLGATSTKRALRDVERWLEAENASLERQGAGARFIPLRRSGYMSVSPPILQKPRDGSYS